MDEIDAAESGWKKTSKRKGNNGRNDGSEGTFLNGKSEGKMSGKFSRLWIGIGAFLTLIAFLVILALMVGLESSRKILKIHKGGGGCTACEDLDVLGGEKFVTFERSKNEMGCIKLEVQCGLEKGTEAILQWFNGGQNMGASFMEEMGQSNVRRAVECNGEGQFELDENGHRGIVTAVECIVATTHEEL